VFSIAGIVIGIIISGGGGEPNATPMPTLEPVPVSTVITGDGILRRIESTSKLQTTVYRIDTVVRAKKEGSWVFNIGGQNLILFVQGSVTAGVDLSELKSGDIQISQDNHTIKIILPPAKIFDAKLDDYEVETFEGEKPDDVDLKLLEDALSAGQLKVKEIACTDKILDRATSDSKLVFENMMRLMEFEGFDIIVESSSITSCEFEVKL
jgi:hypothetical protein